MRLIKSKNTLPEIVVRKVAYALGYRFRVHATELPGRPDVVFRKRKKVIFVHGCFWHQHHECIDGRIPKSRTDYWKTKLLANEQRDQKHIEKLHDLGWRVLTIWECETRDRSLMEERLRDFLS